MLYGGKAGDRNFRREPLTARREQLTTVPIKMVAFISTARFKNYPGDEEIDAVPVEMIRVKIPNDFRMFSLIQY